MANIAKPRAHYLHPLIGMMTIQNTLVAIERSVSKKTIRKAISHTSR